MSKKSIKAKDPLLLEFARKIRMRRHELNLTQEELAEAADIHVNFVGGIERASRNPSLTSIIKMARALKLDPKDLMPS
jgi:transcriptional regulator with XRE-family HTH domain